MKNTIKKRKDKREKRPLNDLINEGLMIWNAQQHIAFLGEITELLKLYEVDETDDWVAIEAGGDVENVRNVRLIRTMYLVSRIAEMHSGILLYFKSHLPKLYKRMEKESLEEKQNHYEHSS